MTTDLMSLPKAELHLHIEGTLEPELAFALARRNGVALPADSTDELRSMYDFDDLQSFLDLYYACMSALLTPDDFRELAEAYFQRAAAEGVRHAELFFDPQAHLVRGVEFDTVVDGLLDGCRAAEKRFGITSSLIMCFLRDQPVAEAEQVLDLALQRQDDFVGVGLDSAEVGYPPSLFTAVLGLLQVRLTPER